MTEARGRPPLLLVIGTGGRPYREYLLRSIGSAYRVHLLADSEPSWERPYITGATVLDMTDTVGADAMCLAARELAGTEPIAGVLTWDEARVLQAAKVAAHLGLPGGDPDAVLRCRDKSLTRKALDAAGVAQPRSVLAVGEREALRAAEEIGYPVVVKPRAMAASLGVVRVDTPGDLLEHFTFARDVDRTLPGCWHYDSVLVEEYVAGAEISVDSAVHNGQVYPMFLARKDIGYAPYFEEVGHLVDAADPLLADPDLRRLVQDTHTALGFTDGMTHTEVKLTPAGPKIIEVNARLGGDLIPRLGQLASGVDPGLVAAGVACGRFPEIMPSWARVGGVRFCYVERDDTVIDAVRIDRDALPSAVEEFVVLAEPGQVFSPPPKGTLFGRIAFATAVAATAAECRAALDAAAAALTVEPAEVVVG